MPKFADIVVIKKDGITDSAKFPMSTTSVSFGAALESDIRIKLDKLPNNACRVYYEDTKMYVKLEEKCRLLVNGEAVKKAGESVEVHNSDIINIGDMEGLNSRAFRIEIPCPSTPKEPSLKKQGRGRPPSAKKPVSGIPTAIRSSIPSKAASAKPSGIPVFGAGRKSTAKPLSPAQPRFATSTPRFGAACPAFHPAPTPVAPVCFTDKTPEIIAPPTPTGILEMSSPSLGNISEEISHENLTRDAGHTPGSRASRPASRPPKAPKTPRSASSITDLFPASPSLSTEKVVDKSGKAVSKNSSLESLLDKELSKERTRLSANDSTLSSLTSTSSPKRLHKSRRLEEEDLYLHLSDEEEDMDVSVASRFPNTETENPASLSFLLPKSPAVPRRSATRSLSPRKTPKQSPNLSKKKTPASTPKTPKALAESSEKKTPKTPKVLAESSAKNTPKTPKVLTESPDKKSPKTPKSPVEMKKTPKTPVEIKAPKTPGAKTPKTFKTPKNASISPVKKVNKTPRTASLSPTKTPKSAKVTKTPKSTNRSLSPRKSPVGTKTPEKATKRKSQPQTPSSPAPIQSVSPKAPRIHRTPRSTTPKETANSLSASSARKSALKLQLSAGKKSLPAIEPDSPKVTTPTLSHPKKKQPPSPTKTPSSNIEAATPPMSAAPAIFATPATGSSKKYRSPKTRSSRKSVDTLPGSVKKAMDDMLEAAAEAVSPRKRHSVSRTRSTSPVKKTPRTSSAAMPGLEPISPQESLLVTDTTQEPQLTPQPQKPPETVVSRILNSVNRVFFSPIVKVTPIKKIGNRPYHGGQASSSAEEEEDSFKMTHEIQSPLPGEGFSDSNDDSFFSSGSRSASRPRTRSGFVPSSQSSTPHKTPKNGSVKKTPASEVSTTSTSRSLRSSFVAETPETENAKSTPKSARKSKTQTPMQQTPETMSANKRSSAAKKLKRLQRSDKTPKMSGLKKLLAEPKVNGGSPLKNADLRRLFKEVEKEVPEAGSLDGVRELLASPRVALSPIAADLRRLYGLKEGEGSSPRLAGLRDLMASEPRKGRTASRLSGVRDLLREPNSPPAADLSGVGDLLAASPIKKLRKRRSSSFLVPIQSPERVVRVVEEEEEESVKPRGTRGRKAAMAESPAKEPTPAPTSRTRQSSVPVNPTPAKTPKSQVKRGRKASETPAEKEDEEATPAPKRATRGAKTKVVESVEEEAEEGEESVAPKRQLRTRQSSVVQTPAKAPPRRAATLKKAPSTPEAPPKTRATRSTVRKPVAKEAEEVEDAPKRRGRPRKNPEPEPQTSPVKTGRRRGAVAKSPEKAPTPKKRATRKAGEEKVDKDSAKPVRVTRTRAAKK